LADNSHHAAGQKTDEAVNREGNQMSKSICRLMLTVGVLTLAAAANATEPGTVPGTNTTCAPGTPEVIIYHAGALTAAFPAVEGVVYAANRCLRN
jgi:hypothetical protein